jgi:hypothetical protein
MKDKLEKPQAGMEGRKHIIYASRTDNEDCQAITMTF